MVCMLVQGGGKTMSTMMIGSTSHHSMLRMNTCLPYTVLSQPDMHAAGCFYVTMFC